MFKSSWNLITRSSNQLHVRNGWKFNHFARRNLSVLSVHTSFPATLFRWSWGHTTNLFDHAKERKGLDLPCDRVSISKDGLVYPALLNSGGIQVSTNVRYHSLTIIS